MRQRLSFSSLLVCLLILPGALVAASDAQKPAHPTFSPAAIASLNKQMHALVTDKHAAPGIVTLIVQGGKTVDSDAFGFADAEKKAPMHTDSVMAIASMTKPVTGVAMMILYEQGKWTLDDPIAKHVPEFKDL